MIQIAVLDDWQKVASQVVDWSALSGVGQLHFLHDCPAAPDRLVPFDVICVMRERTRFDEALLARLPNLKLLVTGGMRNAALDLEACARRGVQVAGTDSYKHAAPELTWALLMALTRNLVGEANSLRAGGWQVGLGGDLHGRTLALLGLGSIGEKVARFGQAFGMRVIAWSENLTAERAGQVGVELVSKRGLFAQADYLSVHLVLSERTRHTVDAEALGWLRPHALLVNTSRGPIVDEQALIEALQAGRLAGAALDVFGKSPYPPTIPSATCPTCWRRRTWAM